MVGASGLKVWPDGHLGRSIRIRNPRGRVPWIFRYTRLPGRPRAFPAYLPPTPRWFRVCSRGPGHSKIPILVFYPVLMAVGENSPYGGRAWTFRENTQRFTLRLKIMCEELPDSGSGCIADGHARRAKRRLSIVRFERIPARPSVAPAFRHFSCVQCPLKAGAHKVIDNAIPDQWKG